MERVIWLVFLIILLLLGFFVSVFPLTIARLLGASTQMQQSRYLTVWRVLGVLVAIGAVIELFIRTLQS